MRGSYEEYRGMLLVSKHGLDDALEHQADVMERISAEVTRTSAEFRRAKEALALAEGRITRKVKDADPKATVAVIEAEVRGNADRKSAWRELQEAQDEADRWSHLLEAWKQRGYSIKTLSDLYAANYFSVSGHTRPGGEDARRAAIRQASEGRDARAARIAEDSARDAAAPRRHPGPPPAPPRPPPARRRAE